MRSIILLSISALAAIASAASNANPFKIPADGYQFTAGEPTTLSWDPTTSGTITLKLQWGSYFTSDTGSTIVSNLPNSGSYTWDVPSDIAAQPDYAIEIISDEDTSEVNYTGRFTVAGATGIASTSTASATTTKTASTTSTATTTSGTPSTMTTVTSSSASPSSSSSTTSGSSTTSSSSTTTRASSTSSATSSSTSVPNSNGGVINRISGGMMALVMGVIAVM